MNHHHVSSRLFSMTPVALLLCLLLFGPVVLAQQGRGTIFGTVTDATGAVVPGATVTVTNTATNLGATTITNDSGYYSVPNLLVGGYSVAVTKEGFKKGLRSGLTLEVDQKAQVDLTLETGAVTEVLEITAQGALADTATATIGKVIENRRVQELPLNGRNALSLVLLAPAVQSGAGPTAAGFGDRGTQVALIRINGSPLATNNFLADGLSSVNAYVPDVSVNPNVDSVQEFKVQSNTMSPEYGYTLGGAARDALQFLPQRRARRQFVGEQPRGAPEIAAALQPVWRLHRRPHQLSDEGLRAARLRRARPQLLLL